MLYVMYRQIVIAGETDEVMLVALVVAHEDVLAMHTPVVLPPPLRLLNGPALRMVVRRERYSVLLQVPKHFRLTFGYDVVSCHVCDICIRPLGAFSFVLVQNNQRADDSGNPAEERQDKDNSHGAATAVNHRQGRKDNR